MQPLMACTRRVAAVNAPATSPLSGRGWVFRRDSTNARNESYLRSLVLPSFAEMPIAGIGPLDVQA